MFYNWKRNLHGWRNFCIQEFPFISSDFDSMTIYELLNKVICYLKEIGELSESTAAAFKELKDYVDNYFKNLDVQEEINNKIDEMYRDGTLTEIIDNIFASLQDQISKNKLDIALTAWRNSEYKARVYGSGQGLWNPPSGTGTDKVYNYDFPFIYVDCVNGTDGLSVPGWNYSDGVPDIPPIGREGFRGSHALPFKTIDNAITCAGRYFNDVRIILKENGIYNFNAGLGLTINVLHIYQGDSNPDVTINVNGNAQNGYPKCTPTDVTIKVNNWRNYMPHIRITGHPNHRLKIETNSIDNQVIYNEGGNLYLWNCDIRARLQALNGTLNIINCSLHGMTGYNSNVFFGDTSASEAKPVPNIFNESARSSTTSNAYYFAGCQVSFHPNNPMRIQHPNGVVETGRDNWQFRNCHVLLGAKCGRVNYTEANQKFFRLIFRTCTIEACTEFTNSFRNVWVGSYAEDSLSNIDNWNNTHPLPS